MNETTFLELRAKDVINVVDGKRLGRILDIVINLRNGRVMGLVLPGNKNFLGLFKSNGELFVPFRNICKIGNDVILVELYYNNVNKVSSCELKNDSDCDENFVEEQNN